MRPSDLALGLAVMLVATLRVAATPPPVRDEQSVGRESTPAKKFSKAWQMDDLLPSIVDLGTGRDWNVGRDVFKRAACGACHAFGSESTGIDLAPDLTSVASQYTRDFILQSILEPSATVNARFLQTTFTLKNGTVVTGTVMDIVDKKIRVAPVILAPQGTVDIAEGDVKSQAPSSVSAMPPGLLNEFTKEQIIELMAFLDSGGDRFAPIYKKK